jgi:hypothetical protein
LKVTGSCHCGRIRLEAEIDPARVRVCHCTDCQKLSGSAFRVTVPVAERDVSFSGDAPSTYLKRSESGNQRLHAFCSHCGTPLYATTPSGVDRKFGLRVGLLDQKAELAPLRQFWLRSKLPWLPALPGEAHETQ